MIMSEEEREREREELVLVMIDIWEGEIGGQPTHPWASYESSQLKLEANPISFCFSVVFGFCIFTPYPPPL